MLVCVMTSVVFWFNFNNWHSIFTIFLFIFIHVLTVIQSLSFDILPKIVIFGSKSAPKNTRFVFDILSVWLKFNWTGSNVSFYKIVPDSLAKGLVDTETILTRYATPSERSQRYNRLQQQQQQHYWTMTTTTKNKPKIVFVLGAPGSGDDIQCSNIVKECNYVVLSVRDLLLAERNRPGSELVQIEEVPCTLEHIRAHRQNVPVAVKCSLLERAMNEQMQVSECIVWTVHSERTERVGFNHRISLYDS